MSEYHLKPYDVVFVNAFRKRTFGNVYNYNYWECGFCGWHPGSSEGPPNLICLNCKNQLYVEEKDAATKIQILKTECGYGFDILKYLKLENPNKENYLEMLKELIRNYE